MAFARQNWLISPSTDRMFLIQTTPRYWRKTRVGNSRHNPSGRRWGRSPICSMSTPGFRRYTYQTVPGRSGWPSRDPIEELGIEVFRQAGENIVTPGPNLYTFVLNDPNDRIDLLGLRDCPAWAEYMTQHPPSEESRDLMEAEAAIISLFTPWPGDEGVAGAVLAKKLKDCLGKCKNVRCAVRWHGKHHPFGGVKKCHLEFQCWINGKPGKPNKLYVPLPDSLCPPGKK